MTVQATELRNRFEAHRHEHPRAWHRDVARALGVSEAELVAAGAGVSATPLEPRWDDLFAALPELGPVKTITRNEACVLEKWGTYGPVERFGHMAQVVGADIDLRIFVQRWTSLFAVEQESARGVRRSLQVFDRHGDSVHKLYLETESNVTRYDALIAALAAPETVLATPVPPGAVSERPDSEVDVSGLRVAWDAMCDTHEFFALLGRFRASRTQALRLAGEERASEAATDRLEPMLCEAARLALPIMVFVSSRGMIQIHTGPVRSVRRSHGYLNVLDPSLNLHVRDELIARAWVVRKPTAHGIVTSFEVYDARGETIALLFGKRKPGQRENEAWRALVENVRVR